VAWKTASNEAVKLDPRSRIRNNVGIATRMRMVVTMFAGVTIALCPNRFWVFPTDAAVT